MLTPPTPSPRRARRTNVSKALPSPPRVGLVTARLGPRLETLMHQQDPHNFAEYVRSTVNLIRAFTMFKIQGPEPPLVDVVPPCGREGCQAIPRGCDKLDAPPLLPDAAASPPRWASGASLQMR